jgi:hypothetical protein
MSRDSLARLRDKQITNGDHSFVADMGLPQLSFNSARIEEEPLGSACGERPPHSARAAYGGRGGLSLRLKLKKPHDTGGGRGASPVPLRGNL